MTEKVLIKVYGPVYFQTISEKYIAVDALKGLDAVDNTILRTARVIVTSGTLGVSRDEIERLPALGLICTIGTGYENVDLDAAFERGIHVTHAAGANAPAVAELAMGLLIALVRKIPRYFDAIKDGRWRGDILPQPMIAGKRLGIYGMGGIGRRIAYIALSFGMKVSYCSRSKKTDLDLPFYESLEALAFDVDVLIVAAPGGRDTFHAVDGKVLRNLGPGGYLVNVGRGTVVDTRALLAALNNKQIAGAALDVYETEPNVPEELQSLENVVLTPHIGGVSSDVQIVSARLIVRNVDAFLSGSALASPIPEMLSADIGARR